MNNPVLSSLKYVLAHLTRPKLGEDYYDDLSDLYQQIGRALQSGDNDQLLDAAEELKMTKGFIEDDIKGDPEEHAPLITDRDYRIALRKLGISDYPEKGTVNDPEIDEHGNLSSWAQAGYPLVQKDIYGEKGRGELAGTLYKPGEEERGEVMSDKHIARDIGVSAQSIGIIWRKLQDKLSSLAEQLYEHHAWAGDLDAIDLRILREACNKIAFIIIEETCIASRIMLG
jgi:hypothetical protein